MNKVAEYAKLFTTIAAAIGVAYGAIQFQISFVEDKAKEIVEPVSKKVKALEERLTLNELKDLLKEALSDLYYWRDMARKYPDDQDVKDKLAEAEATVKEIKERIRQLEEESDE